MKESIFLAVIFLTSLVGFEAWRPAIKSTSAFQTFTTQFIREEAAGVILLKSFGSGYTQAECIQNAKYNAVRDVIFKGVSGANDQRPLLMGANPEEKYRNFFTGFFAQDGPFNSFVSTSNRGNIDKNDRLDLRDGGCPCWIVHSEQHGHQLTFPQEWRYRFFPQGRQDLHDIRTPWKKYVKHHDFKPWWF